jgi:hypothetical protein
MKTWLTCVNVTNPNYPNIAKSAKFEESSWKKECLEGFMGIAASYVAQETSVTSQLG